MLTDRELILNQLRVDLEAMLKDINAGIVDISTITQVLDSCLEKIGKLLVIESEEMARAEARGLGNK